MADCEAELLISLVKSRRAIYDSTLTEHGSRNILEKLWSEISHEMNKSVTECKAKWASLRNSYARVLREGKPRVSGRKRRKWYLADSMDFLHNFMNQNKPNSTTSTLEYWEEQANSLDEVIDYEIEEEIEEVNTKDFHENPTSTGHQTTSKSERPGISNELIRPIIEHLLAEAKSTDKDNPEWGFFKSLMPDVSKLSRKRRRKFKEIVLTNLNRLLEEDEQETDEFISVRKIHY